MALLPLLVTLVAGAALPVQAGINSRLGKEMGSPFVASLISFLIGTASILIFVLLSRVNAPEGGYAVTASRLPWWIWLGGVIGAVFVTVAATFASRIGFSLFSAVVIAGQLLTSVGLDHFGLLGAERHPVSLLRLGGIALLIAGIALIRRG
ncbi:MAG: DMT family transporter [Fibrella sp.]|nr:DMT family transporter [Armatimonadota bacterium]